jgi:hypothetical protein
MALDTLTTSVWLDTECKTNECSNPTWAEVADAICALDGRSINDVYLTPTGEDPETYLCIGGGDGRYIVSGSVKNERFPTLIDETRLETPQEEIVCGGQAGLFPANWVVDLQRALRAAQDFYESSGFDGETRWIDA